MKKFLLLLSLCFIFIFPFILHAQIPKTISYEGVLQKDGKSFQGNATFVFTLFKGNTIVWKSLPKEIHVNNGLFGTILGPFHDSINFNGTDSLGITYDGIELSPKAAFTAVAYSLSAFHALIADSSIKPGPKGDKGDLGVAGVKGDNGLDGSAGVNGMQGIKGDKGDGGLTGLTGIQGVKGDDGALGGQGLKGDKGDGGVTGSTGIQGVKGDDGALGGQGLKGDKGLDGSSGAQGSAGADGTQGIKGDKGDGGVTGSTGIQGVKGDDGALGSQGLKGDKGLDGSSGAQGLKGDIGATGSNGANGLQGIQGASGSLGAQGVKGDKGVNSVSLTNSSSSANIFSLNDVALVRSGDALTLRLENSTSPIMDATYSAFWHTTSAVGTSNGMVPGGSQVVFDVHLAYQFSIMVKVGNQWGKIDLFRVDLAATDWYGSWTSN